MEPILLLISGGLLILAGGFIGYEYCLQSERRCDAYCEFPEEPTYLPLELIRTPFIPDCRCLRREGHTGPHHFEPLRPAAYVNA